MDKLNLRTIPYGKRQGECVKCLQSFSEHIKPTRKEFIKNGFCKKCSPTPQINNIN